MEGRKGIRSQIEYQYHYWQQLIWIAYANTWKPKTSSSCSKDREYCIFIMVFVHAANTASFSSLDFLPYSVP